MFDKESYENFDKIIKNNSSLVKVFQPGFFYSFFYDYKSNPDNFKLPKNIKDFYDVRPVIYLFNLKESNKGNVLGEGLNFHFFPIHLRKRWLNILSKMSGQIEKRKDFIKTAPSDIKKILTSPSLGYRNYDLKRIVQLRRIDFKAIEEILEYIPKTFENAKYGRN